MKEILIPTDLSDGQKARVMLIQTRLSANLADLDKWRKILQVEQDSDMTRVLNFTSDVVIALENRENYLSTKLTQVLKEIKAQSKSQVSTSKAGVAKEVEITPDLFRLNYDVPRGGMGLINPFTEQEVDKLDGILKQVAHQDPKARKLLADDGMNETIEFRLGGKIISLAKRDGIYRWHGYLNDIKDLRKNLNKDVRKAIIQSFKRKPASRHAIEDELQGEVIEVSNFSFSDKEKQTLTKNFQEIIDWTYKNKRQPKSNKSDMNEYKLHARLEAVKNNPIQLDVIKTNFKPKELETQVGISKNSVDMTLDEALESTEHSNQISGSFTLPKGTVISYVAQPNGLVSYQEPKSQAKTFRLKGKLSNETVEDAILQYINS